MIAHDIRLVNYIVRFYANYIIKIKYQRKKTLPCD